MSYEAYYGYEDDREESEGDIIASGGGWVDWGEWVLEQDELEECHTLYSEGWAMIEGLRNELATIATEGTEDQQHVTARLIAIVDAAPDGATALLVTDGTDSDGEDDDTDE